MAGDLNTGREAAECVCFTEVLPLRKTGHTSKGDQLKWKLDRKWYKADYMGYEGLAEVLVSHLLQKSTVKHPFVLYEPVQIEYGGTVHQGCSSVDFLSENQILIPLEKLYRQFTGDSLALKLVEFEAVSDRIRYVVDEVEQITGITGFGAYLTAMIEIDTFFLNEDRHTNNIAVLYDEEMQQYSLSPFFDQGLCLFADMCSDYPLSLPFESCLQKIEAKPFHRDFDEQLDAAEELYGIQLHFHFSIKEVQRELEALAPYYSVEIRNRVEALLQMQIRKYAYLMKQ